jgi:hypothetical protein
VSATKHKDLLNRIASRGQWPLYGCDDSTVATDGKQLLAVRITLPGTEPPPEAVQSVLVDIGTTIAEVPVATLVARCGGLYDLGPAECAHSIPLWAYGMLFDRNRVAELLSAMRGMVAVSLQPDRLALQDDYGTVAVLMGLHLRTLLPGEPPSWYVRPAPVYAAGEADDA